MIRRMWMRVLPCLLVWTVPLSLSWAQPAYQLQDLGEFLPFGINNKGAILGHKGIWEQGRITPVAGPMWDLEAINAKGEIVGAGLRNGRQQAFAAPQVSGPYTWLPTAPEAWASAANGVNARGDIVGVEAWADGVHAVLWIGGTTRRVLLSLWGFDSWALDVNSFGQVVGVSNMAAGSRPRPTF
jgi:uncharacterized membrane protein